VKPINEFFRIKFLPLAEGSHLRKPSQEPGKAGVIDQPYQRLSGCPDARRALLVWFDPTGKLSRRFLKREQYAEPLQQSGPCADPSFSMRA